MGWFFSKFGPDVHPFWVNLQPACNHQLANYRLYCSWCKCIQVKGCNSWISWGTFLHYKFRVQTSQVHDIQRCKVQKSVAKDPSLSSTKKNPRFWTKQFCPHKMFFFVWIWMVTAPCMKGSVGMSQLGGFQATTTSQHVIGNPKDRTRKSRKNHYPFFLLGCVSFWIDTKFDKMVFYLQIPQKNFEKRTANQPTNQPFWGKNPQLVHFYWKEKPYQDGQKLPEWLTFDPQAKEFHGTPSQGDGEHRGWWRMSQEREDVNEDEIGREWCEWYKQ